MKTWGYRVSKLTEGGIELFVVGEVWARGRRHAEALARARWMMEVGPACDAHEVEVRAWELA